MSMSQSRLVLNEGINGFISFQTTSHSHACGVNTGLLFRNSLCYQGAIPRLRRGRLALFDSNVYHSTMEQKQLPGAGTNFIDLGNLATS